MPLSLLDLPAELVIEISAHSNNPHLPLVCRSLCNIIYSTPSLWSFIYIGIKQQIPGGQAFLDRRLERSATCPLDIVIIDSNSHATTMLWTRLASHRDRIRSLEINTDMWILTGRILCAILLDNPSTSLPSLRKLSIRHDEDLVFPFQSDLPMDPSTLLRSMANLFSSLTTLVLPCIRQCIIVPEAPILSLRTLILDVSLPWKWSPPSSHKVAQLLVKVPNLETLWCKDHNMFTDFPPNINPLPIDGPPLHFPVFLPKLIKLAATVPGIGVALLKAIEAPALQDLHLDGTRDDEADEDLVAWLESHPRTIHSALQLTASRSPLLRRLALVRAYIPRDAWEWILGCTSHDTNLPFPHLVSIAVRQMEAVKWEVTNAVDNALMELYAKKGRLILRRFAYLASEPQLRGVALHQFINGVTIAQVPPDEIFELELDGTFGVDTKERLDDLLLTKGVRVILHEERPQRKGWWSLGGDIDPTEADSY
ncbi:hypothetical protein BDN70DRAFT_927770 [Pholiota conissans]|uniref:F-box domain-containing protein n=1 Tax=Pholiota conissans TaxID=109636 RepID=A0A9P5ZCM3_9AGAR|nr:hypothetical protein BDN70DRAFT_927770 [Pholiota conissans]